MKESNHSFSLVLVYVGAFLSPLLAARLRVPAAVAEILFGILIGVNGLGLVQPGTLEACEWIVPLADDFAELIATAGIPEPEQV